jgi:hypothetical protein
MVIRNMRAIYVMLGIAKHMRRHTEMAGYDYVIGFGHEIHEAIPGGGVRTITDKQLAVAGMTVLNTKWTIVTQQNT